MRYLSIILIFLTITHLSKAQKTGWLTESAEENSRFSLNEASPQLKLKPSYTLTAGSTVSRINGNTLFSTSVSPSVSIPVSERFSLRAGAIVGTGNMFLFPTYYGESFVVPSTGRFNNHGIFVSGEYQLTPSIKIFGTGYIERYTLLDPEVSGSQNAFTMQSGSIGMEYQVSRNSWIRFEVQTSTMNNSGLFYNQVNDPFQRNSRNVFIPGY